MQIIYRSAFLLLLSGTLVTAVYSAAPATTLPKALKNPKPRILDTPPKSLPQFSAQELESPDVSRVSDEASPGANGTPPSTEAFDAVPHAYRDAIAERLQVTSELVRLGRAYDYRSKTTGQLQEILRSLRNEEASIPLPPAPPTLNDAQGTWAD